MREIFVKGGFCGMILVAVFLRRSCRGKRSADGENFHGQENRAFVCALHKARHVGNSRKGRHTLCDLHIFRSVRFGKHTANRSDRSGRSEFSGKSLCSLRRTDGGEHFPHLIKFERHDRSFKISDLFHNLFTSVYQQSTVFSIRSKSSFFGSLFKRSYRKLLHM